MAYGRMDDGYESAVDGLLRKRAILAGEVEFHRGVMADKLVALDHIDAAIRVLKPDIDLQDMPERVAPPAGAAFRGEVQRFLLEALRKASPGSMDTFELASIIMTKRGLNVGDRIMKRLIAQRTGHTLGRLRARGFVESERLAKGGLLSWRATAKPGHPTGEWRNGNA